MRAIDGSYSAKIGASQSVAKKENSQGIVAGDDFPQLCETCMGNNPYLRMVKLPIGSKLCKITNQPFQAFRWKAGTNARHKETVVSIEVAKHRNICQACLNDMQFGLPVGVRDKLLVSGHIGGNEISVPNSIVGQAYFYQQEKEPDQILANTENVCVAKQMHKFSQSLMSKNVVNPGASSLETKPFISNVAAAAIQRSIRSTAFRNLPRLCSFWVLGTCERVISKLCPFRPCCGKESYAFPEIAGSNRELCNALVKRLEAEGPIAVMKNLDEDTRNALKNYNKGINRDEAIKKRVQGEDDLSSSYLSKIKNANAIHVPNDLSITTLWVGNVSLDIDERDLLEVFYMFGKINNVYINKQNGYAFVEFSTHAEAEIAVNSLHNSLFVKGHALTLNWAKSKPNRDAQQGTSNKRSIENNNTSLLPPPPGMEHRPFAEYSLPTSTIPAYSVPFSGSTVHINSSNQTNVNQNNSTIVEPNNSEKEIEDDDDPYSGPLFKKSK